MISQQTMVFSGIDIRFAAKKNFFNRKTAITNNELVYKIFKFFYRAEGYHVSDRYFSDGISAGTPGW